MDTLSREKRSWNMSRIQAKNTAPEMAVRSFLHKSGVRFRLHSSKFAGKPDIVLPKYKTVIFVHGCFWHRHEGCKYAYTPKSRKHFWEDKFRENIIRFEKVSRELSEEKLRVIVIWECEAGNTKVLQRILEVLKDNERRL